MISETFNDIEKLESEFSIQKVHDNGEFLTPSSLVQTIVNVIEPDHDPLQLLLHSHRRLRAVAFRPGQAPRAQG